MWSNDAALAPVSLLWLHAVVPQNLPISDWRRALGPWQKLSLGP